VHSAGFQIAPALRPLGGWRAVAFIPDRVSAVGYECTRAAALARACDALEDAREVLPQAEPRDVFPTEWRAFRARPPPAAAVPGRCGAGPGTARRPATKARNPPGRPPGVFVCSAGLTVSVILLHAPRTPRGGLERSGLRWAQGVEKGKCHSSCRTDARKAGSFSSNRPAF